MVRSILFIFQSSKLRAIKKADKAAILLRAYAQFSITLLCCSCVLKQTNTYHFSLLKEEKKFRVAELEDLFGDGFNEGDVQNG